MDQPVPALTVLALCTTAQDRLSLETAVNALIAAQALASPACTVVGFDVACDGDGATWLATVFTDNSGVTPPAGSIFVPIADARAYFAEALSAQGYVNDLRTQAAFATQRAIAVSADALIVCSRCAAGGAGGKLLIGYLVDNNPTPPPPGIVAPSGSSSSADDELPPVDDDNG